VGWPALRCNRLNVIFSISAFAHIHWAAAVSCSGKTAVLTSLALVTVCAYGLKLTIGNIFGLNLTWLII
jgi:hypothetical protein